MTFSVSDIPFQAKALGALAACLVKSGILAPAGGPRAQAMLLPNLVRYRFTTAREVESGYLACPQRTALIDDDGELTYEQLRNQARNLATYLVNHHAPRFGEEKGNGIRLGVMARNGRGIILPLAAKGYAGATIFLLNIGSSPEQLLGCIEENRINVLVIDDEFIDRLPADVETHHGCRIIVGHSSGKAHDFLSLSDIARTSSAGERTLPRAPKHGDIVLMSSGTTGIPKGIIRPEPTMPSVLASIMDKVPWRADMKVQQTASIFHTWGWACLNIALAARNTVITRRVFDPMECLRDIEKHQIDGLLSSPVFYKRMIEVDPTGKVDTSSLKFIASSGHALSPTLVQDAFDRFGPILANIYGSTELALAAVASAEQLAKEPTIGGTIASGTKLRILDPQGEEVPTGAVGEIHLINSTALTGYTKPGMNVRRVQGLVSIGDLGFIDDKGELHVLGRADDMIIVGGENVHPQSVSETLEAMPGILEVYAGGVEDPETFERVAVWVVPTNDEVGMQLTADDVREFVRDNLADHSVPRDVHFRTELPRNPTGKVVPRML